VHGRRQVWTAWSGGIIRCRKFCWPNCDRSLRRRQRKGRSRTCVCPIGNSPIGPKRPRLCWQIWKKAVALALSIGFPSGILPRRDLSQREAVALYWLYGQLLGEPFAQNVQGTLLYDVRDTGQDVASGARFSVTSYESSFHTDNSFGDSILDYVGLLCLKTAKSGGVSQNVSGLAAVNLLRRGGPEVLGKLFEAPRGDRRGGLN